MLERLHRPRINAWGGDLPPRADPGALPNPEGCRMSGRSLAPPSVYGTRDDFRNGFSQPCEASRSSGCPLFLFSGFAKSFPGPCDTNFDAGLVEGLAGQGKIEIEKKKSHTRFWRVQASAFQSGSPSQCLKCEGADPESEISPPNRLGGFEVRYVPLRDHGTSFPLFWL